MCFTHAPAGQHNLVASLVVLMGAFPNRAAEIDSGHMWVITHQATQAAEHKSVFVIKRRIGHIDGDIAFWQVAIAQLTDG